MLRLTSWLPLALQSSMEGFFFKHSQVLFGGHHTLGTHPLQKDPFRSSPWWIQWQGCSPLGGQTAKQVREGLLNPKTQRSTPIALLKARWLGKEFRVPQKLLRGKQSSYWSNVQKWKSLWKGYGCSRLEEPGLEGVTEVEVWLELGDLRSEA